MNFGHPKMLWIGSILLPLLALFLWVTWRKRQALIRSFVQNKQLAELTLGTSTIFQKTRRALLLLAVAALLLTVARPQWGFAWEQATQRGRDIIVAIDTSRSMLAEDLTPNRLARAKLAALDLLSLGKYDRFGLVAFAGSAFLQCPLTFDDQAFRQSVQILQPGIIPQGGTALGEAIEGARRAFSEDADENHRILILFTDGEDHEQGVLNTAERAAADGMKIFTVGVGTPAGELLRVKDENGQTGFLKDDAGNVVKSRLNEQLLEQIATQSDGFYLPLQGANAMETLYNKGLAPLATSERSTKLIKRLKEQFYWPLSLAIVLLFIEIFVPPQKRAKSKASVLKPIPGTAVALLLALLSIQHSSAGASKAQKHYDAGDYTTALSEYQQMLARHPNDPRLHYNAGAAAYHAKKFDAAIKEFQAAAGSEDIQLQQQSFYNLANAEFRLGESNPKPDEKIAIWERAIQHYDAALKLKPNDTDAQFNRDLVRRKLDALKKEQEQQKQQENQDNKDKQEKEQEKDDQGQQQNPKDSQAQNKENSEEQQSDQQKEENQSPKQNEQQQQQQQQQKQDEKPSDSQPQQNGDKESEDQQTQEPEGDAEAAQLGRMTPAQAKQLLDAQKDEEKALIFIPPGGKSSRQNRTFKDW